MLPDTTLAYAAGVMDSDGYFSIIHRRNSYEMRLGCNQVGDPVPRFLEEAFGGKVYWCAAPGRGRGGWFGWVLTGEGAATFAAAIGPYLVLKRRQAELVVDFVATISREVGVPLSVETIRRRADLYAEMRLLNVSGRGKAIAA